MLEKKSDRQTTIDCCLRSWAFLAFSKKVQLGVSLPKITDYLSTRAIDGEVGVNLLRYLNAISSDQIAYQGAINDDAKDLPPDWYFKNTIDSLLSFAKLPLINKLINLA